MKKVIIRQTLLRRIVPIMLLLLLVTFFSITSEYFFTARNLLTLLRDVSTAGIIAIGVSMVIITAGIDLSTGAMVGFISMLSANLLYYTNIPGILIIVIAIATGIAAGYLNGLLVTVLRLPDFIATLSTLFLFRGLALILAIRSDTGMITNKIITNRTILLLGGHINGVYIVTIVFLLMVIAGQFVLKRTQLGVYIYSVGTDRKAAELSGINTDKIKRAVYTITGFCAGIAALFLMGKIRSVTPNTGTGLEFDVIAAIVVGGCALSGGTGDSFGTAIGALFMSVLVSGIYKYNLPTASQLIIKGGTIVIMVVFDEIYKQYMEKKIRKSSSEAHEDSKAVKL